MLVLAISLLVLLVPCDRCALCFSVDAPAAAQSSPRVQSLISLIPSMQLQQETQQLCMISVVLMSSQVTPALTTKEHTEQVCRILPELPQQHQLSTVPPPAAADSPRDPAAHERTLQRRVLRAPAATTCVRWCRQSGAAYMRVVHLPQSLETLTSVSLSLLYHHHNHRTEALTVYGSSSSNMD
jgi:hypothetical protein